MRILQRLLVVVGESPTAAPLSLMMVVNKPLKACLQGKYLGERLKPLTKSPGGCGGGAAPAGPGGGGCCGGAAAAAIASALDGSAGRLAGMLVCSVLPAPAPAGSSSAGPMEGRWPSSWLPGEGHMAAGLEDAR